MSVSVTSGVLQFESLSSPASSYEVEELINNHEDGDKITRATKISGKILMNHKILISSYMNPESWKLLFPSIVRSCTSAAYAWTDGTVDEDEGASAERNGLKMTAFLGCLSPVKPVKLVRAFKQTPQGGFIVDINNSNRDNRGTVSGVRVEALTDAESMVTIVVQRSYLNTTVAPEYRNLLASAFNAGRWFWALKRECERRAIHGFFFSPVLPPPVNLEEKSTVEIGVLFRSIFASTVDVKDFDPTTRPGVLVRRFSANLRSLITVILDAPQVTVFDACKSLMATEFAGVVRFQIPQESDNSVSLLVLENRDRIIRETYIDPSESLLTYGDQGRAFTGISIYPDGENRSHVTIVTSLRLSPTPGKQKRSKSFIACLEPLSTNRFVDLQFSSTFHISTYLEL